MGHQDLRKPGRRGHHMLRRRDHCISAHLAPNTPVRRARCTRARLAQRSRDLRDQCRLRRPDPCRQDLRDPRSRDRRGRSNPCNYKHPQ
jgi:hypothetical protein